MSQQQGDAPAQNQQGYSWTELIQNMVLAYCVSQIIGTFLKQGNDGTSPSYQQNNFQDQQLLTDQEGINSNEQQNTLNLQSLDKPKQKDKFLRPQMIKGQPFKFDVWFSYYNPQNFFNYIDKGRTDHTGEPVWSSSIDDYDLTYEIETKNQKQLNISIPFGDTNQSSQFFSQIYKKNKTLYLHYQIITPDFQSSKFNKNGILLEQPAKVYRQSISLVKYMKKFKESELVNLMDSTFGDIPMPKKNEIEKPQEDEDQYYPHWKNEIYMNLIYDHTNYLKDGTMPSEVAQALIVDWKQGTYQPIIYLSDFWILKKHLIPMNDTLEGTSLNLTLNFQNYAVYYFQMQQNFEKQLEKQKEWGMETIDLDEMKRMWIETDKILLTVTMIVSLLHSVFEILAFKNDIQFWNSKDSMEGISIKTLYFQVIQSIIIFLYLFDNETSWMIIISSGFGILLELWKIQKASKVIRIEKFPYFTIEDKESYVDSDTKEYDEIAMKYMSYATIPIILGYSVYSILYNQHKSWYSFVLNTLVGSIYTFGFINMTPQLYINYRLKSVEHMPSKALFYRFLNTIIDDLFSFIITMPTLHRISCFRDDVIFVIYLYQRWIYRVDKTRGMYATEKKEEKKEIQDNLKSNDNNEQSSKVDEQNQTQNEQIEEQKIDLINKEKNIAEDNSEAKDDRKIQEDQSEFNDAVTRAEEQSELNEDQNLESKKNK